MDNKQPQQRQIQIKAQDEDLKGKYSNLMQITHTQEEFVLDFFFAIPPQGALASRVILSPGHLKRMTKALQDNIEKYESKFGKIQQAESPESPIGFNL
jgi:3-deoxy-D-manno-octulosonic-acid transferase